MPAVLRLGVFHFGFVGLLALSAAVGLPRSERGPAEAAPAQGGLAGPALPALATRTSGEFAALTYNVAGLPAMLSRSRPDLHMPKIGTLLDGYDLVLLQESWQTPAPNPYWPLRLYHEVLVETASHPYKTPAAPLPLGSDARRPSAFMSDGLNAFSRFPFVSLVRAPWPSCVDTFNDCRALKGFSVARMHLSRDASVDVYNLHMEAGWTVEDHEARERAIEQLVRFIGEYSSGQAVIVGGDFNLRILREPGRGQLQRLLQGTGLLDACVVLDCGQPGKVDRFLFRSGEHVRLAVQSWASQHDVFVADDGRPLSDHDPVAVRFAWSLAGEGRDEI